MPFFWISHTHRALDETMRGEDARMYVISLLATLNFQTYF